jgi:hypothetical protein
MFGVYIVGIFCGQLEQCLTILGGHSNPEEEHKVYMVTWPWEEVVLVDYNKMSYMVENCIVHLADPPCFLPSSHMHSKHIQVSDMVSDHT